MRTEIYCVRSNSDEIAYCKAHLKELAHALDVSDSIHIILKTEIDSNPRKIRKEFVNSVTTDNPPEFYIYANALDTEDSSSFRRLFTPLITLLEKELVSEALILTERKPKQELNLVVNKISVEGAYPAYAFRFQGKKILVLPRMKFVEGSYVDYIVSAVAKAKEIFKTQADNNSQGYIISVPEELATPEPLPEEVFTPDAESSEKISEDITPEEKILLPEEEINLTISAEVTNEEAEEKISAVLEESTEPIPEISSAEFTETPEEAPEEKKKKGGAKALLMSFIPHKGDSIKNIILKIVVLLAIAAFLTGGALLLNFYVIQPAINSSNMHEIQDIYYASYDEASTIIDESGNTVEVSAPTKNWEGLKKINKEIVGWVKIDKTVIDYPVLEHKGDSNESQYYLYRNYKGKPSDFGSIFLDHRCTKSVNSKNIILHGHNMGSDKSMFASLTKYPGNLKYYKAAPIVQFDTPESDGDFVIFSVMKINVSNDNKAIFNYLIGEFDSSAQFMNFIYNIKEMSYLNVDVPINENDQLITLSTCSYEAENMRTVVVGRKIREGEDVSKYIKAAKTKSPAYSITSTFSQEYKDGNVKWYDGEGKLEGDEELHYLEQGDMYLVKYLDGNGKTLTEQYVLKGKNAKPPEITPRKTASNGYYYVFKKWDHNGKNISKNTTIKPIFTKKALKPVESTPFPTVEIEDENWEWIEETEAVLPPEPAEATTAPVTT